MKTIYTAAHKLRNPKTELDGGQLIPPWETSERAEIVRRRVETVKLGQLLEPKDFGLEPLTRIHDAGYLQFIKNCWQDWQDEGNKGEAIPSVWPGRGMRQKIPAGVTGQLGYYSFAAETSISGGTWEAAYASVQVALTAAELVLQGERAAFGLCRPPGHHAAGDYFGGYCFINNAAVAAQWFLDQGDEKVVILDLDFHHGNGTQTIFYQRNDVHFFSLHGNPDLVFPHYLGFEDELGEGEGAGCNRNWVYQPDTPFSEWQQGLEQACQLIDGGQFDRLIISLGVDTFEEDPISFFKLKSADYLTIGQRLEQLNLPTLFLLEGGYAVDDIGVNVCNVLNGFEGTRFP